MHGFKARIIQALRRASEKTLPRLLKYAHAYEFLNGGVLSPKKTTSEKKGLLQHTPIQEASGTSHNEPSLK